MKHVSQNFVIERQSATAACNVHNLLAASSTRMSLIRRDTSRLESSSDPAGQRRNYEPPKKIKVGKSFARFLFRFLVSSFFPASSTWSEGCSYSSSDVRTRNERSCKTFRLENLFLVVELASTFFFRLFQSYLSRSLITVVVALLGLGRKGD